MFSRPAFKLNEKQFRFLVSFFFLAFTISAQTTVNSLSALKPYLNANNANVKLAPGTYRITEEDVDDGKFTNPLLQVNGSNNTIDFSGVTIEIETEVFRSFGGVEVIELDILGNNNVLKNLTMVDDGSVYDRPHKTALGIKMDGENNRIEGFHMTVKGSQPYGYGDAFGKGGGYVIQHFKHSAILVRGNSNHVKNCTIIHKAYGHGIFMQGAYDPLIEGCYVEGELRTTNDILAEEGTGSAADNVDFMTDWDYKLPAGYTLSLQEDGIRTYGNDITTIINGVEQKRGTTNPTVINCTVKNMRGGVKITSSSGDRYIENCTAINCEVGFALGSGDIINCKGDANIGPLYSTLYGNSGNVNGDITILPSTSTGSGSNVLAYVGGSKHDITFKGSESDVNPDQNLKIMVSGELTTIRHLFGINSGQNNHGTSDSEINNLSGYPIIYHNDSKNIDGESCGPFTDNGSGNDISYSDNCELVEVSCDGLDAFSLIQAENFCLQSGIQTGATNSFVGWVNSGDWVKYESIDFGSGANSISINASSGSSGGTLEVRSGSVSGVLLSSIDVENTGGWTNFDAITANVNNATGEQDIYFVFTGGSGYLFDIDSFQFNNENTPITPTANCSLPWTGTTMSVSRETLNYVSETIDISCASNITISMDIEGIGTMEDADYLHVYYSVNGGVKQVLSQNVNAFDLKTVSKSGINGNTLQLYIDAQNSATAEVYTISNISINESSLVADFSRIEAEDFSTMNGIQTEVSTESGENVGWTHDGDWIRFDDVNLSGAQSVDIRVASETTGGTIELRTGSANGTLIGSVNVSNTGGWQNWNTINTSINNVSGIQDVYLVFTGGDGYLLNVNWLEFLESAASAKTINGIVTDENHIVIYPNPVKSITTIKGAQGSTLKVYDMKGSLLITKNIILESEQVDLTSFSSGIYYANISSLKSIEVIKIVKE